LIDLRALWDFARPKINRKRFDALAETTPKRVCFASTHPNALKIADKGPIGYFNVPFSETIGNLFPWQIFSNKFGYSRTVKTTSEFEEIASWVAANRDVVFIRSLFESCIAACEHQSDSGRSEVGELEYRAKWKCDEHAVSRLADHLIEIYQRLLSGRGINAICAVPSSTPGKASLPCKLAEALSTKFALENITCRLSWDRQKDTIKDKPAAEKWELLEAVGMKVDGTLDGKNVLIVDDMYQSGATVHFIASRLRDAGSGDIHCLAVSKARSDKDNV
jgi:adenine/guanine phosphoribosyltransferase-like PRPP-binding protein